ncbi:hypothetical protein GQ44DRAFT_633835, partial [Phaeosphaeriaceae sp. PMI808]
STSRDRGRWEEAEELKVQVIETSKSKLGADYSSTLTSMNSLAFKFKCQGAIINAIFLIQDC